MFYRNFKLSNVRILSNNFTLHVTFITVIFLNSNINSESVNVVN